METLVNKKIKINEKNRNEVLGTLKQLGYEWVSNLEIIPGEFSEGECFLIIDKHTIAYNYSGGSREEIGLDDIKRVLKNNIIFKSTPEKWEREMWGTKSNTVRKIDFNDKRFIELLERVKKAKEQKNINFYCFMLGEITIQNSETKEKFTRNLTDITVVDNYMILSWRS